MIMHNIFCKGVDHKCNGCGAHGHKIANCYFLAKIFFAMKQINKLDDTKKQNMINNSQQDQVCKQNCKYHSNVRTLDISLTVQNAMIRALKADDNSSEDHHDAHHSLSASNSE